MGPMEAATKITVKLPDGTPLELPDGASGADAAAAIGPGLAKAALAIRVDGALRDLSAPLPDGAEIAILTDRDPEALELIRHDAAHVMAEAVMELYPGTKVTIGPPIEQGFYYDFEFPPDARVTEEDLERIEAAMRAHIKADEPFERRDVPVAEAIEIFREQGQDYKVELIEDLVRDEGVETVSLYRNGPFEDLCRGPHAPATGRIKAIKLNSLAGAYWRGDESRAMLTRIYGTAFFSKKDLDRHLERIEQAKARDHRRLGPQLGIFMLRKEAPGMPFWLPHGTTLLRLIEAEVQKQLRKREYVEIKTPHLMDVELWHRSGHWDNYQENMYFTESKERQYAIRPMNCPGACLVFDSERHSYRELPLRVAEFGQVSRAEREGVLHGLLRVRAFTQDDAHIYCTPEQIVDEVTGICEAIDELYARFGFDDVHIELSTRPDKSIGSEEQWEQAEAALHSALESQGRELHAQPRRRRLLRPEDRLPHHRRARPLLAVRHLPGRLLHARTLRPHLHRPERRGAAAGDDPPRPARLAGALRRHPDRAPRRPLPGLAGAGAGDSAADLRPPRRVRRPGRGRAARARRAGRGRPALGVDRQEGARRRTVAQSLHARRRRPRGGERRGRGALARRGRAGLDGLRGLRRPRPPRGGRVIPILGALVRRHVKLLNPHRSSH